MKMLIKVLPILHIIATYYHIQCLEPTDPKELNDKTAMPPNAYEVMNNFDYEYPLPTPNPLLDKVAELMAIQYAPLAVTNSDNHKHTHAPSRTEAPIENGLNKGTKNIKHKPHELEEKVYLQPQWSSAQTIERQQKPRSFFSPHDVSVLQTNQKARTNGHNVYRTYHNHVDQERVRNAGYTSFLNPRQENPEEALLPDGQTVLYLPGSRKITPLQEKKYVRKVVPFVLTKPYLQGAFSKYQEVLQKPSSQCKYPKSSTQKPLSAALQAISALSPGLHLNLARVYGIAHINDHRHIDVPHRREKTPIMNRKSVDKKKIVLNSLPKTK